MDYNDVLLKLCELEAHNKPLRISGKQLGQIIGYSQQSTSRILKILQQQKKIVINNGQITVTENGINELKTLAQKIHRALALKPTFKLKGKVFSGVGDGRYYLSLEYYKKAVKKACNFNPYPGTLNIKLDPEFISDAEIIRAMAKKCTTGKKENKRFFGGFCVVGCRLNKTKCFVIIPERTHYDSSVLEIISQYNLRKRMNLKDGDTLDIYIP